MSLCVVGRVAASGAVLKMTIPTPSRGMWQMSPDTVRFQGRPLWTKPLEVGQGPITLVLTLVWQYDFFPSSSSVLWWHTCVSLAMGRLRQESKASLGYIERSCLSKQMAKSFQPSSCFLKTTLPARPPTCLPTCLLGQFIFSCFAVVTCCRYQH